MANGLVVWLTGLSGAGKSTIARSTERMLNENGLRTTVVDGDAIRASSHNHLDFSNSGIQKNNEAIASLCKEVRQEHDVVFVAVISPFDATRQKIRRMLEPGYYLVFVDAPLSVVCARDTKGLYSKAERGEIDGVIGFCGEVPYERPSQADLVIETEFCDSEESSNALVEFLLSARNPEA